MKTKTVENYTNLQRYCGDILLKACLAESVKVTADQVVTMMPTDEGVDWWYPVLRILQECRDPLVLECLIKLLEAPDAPSGCTPAEASADASRGESVQMLGDQRLLF